MSIAYYDKFSKVYDLVSSKYYYRNPRTFAIAEMQIAPGQTILNIPCGTGQNFEGFEHQLHGSGKIIGIDLSKGMLSKAKKKIDKNSWSNITVFQEDANKIDRHWVENNLQNVIQFDSILCDLGLSGFPDWENTIDNLLALLKPTGRLVIMDWYIPNSSLRGSFIKWIGKGEVNRPLWQYLESQAVDFRLNKSFKGGDMFVASGCGKF